MQVPSKSAHEHRFSADRPLEKLVDDELGRAGFARRLATDIMGWHGNDSLVLSLNGAWGSGKSTIKNFIKECLPDHGNPIVVEFNPWEWSGQQMLLEGFFGAIRVKFAETDVTKETEAMATRWERLEALTKLGASFSEKFEKALAPLLGGSVTATLIANGSTTPWLRFSAVTIGLVLVCISSFLAVCPDIAAQFIVWIRTGGKPQPKTLSAIRKAITTELIRLRANHQPVIVIVDDIDRLTAEEVRLLFQLIKVNADFPNLVYLLLFEEEIIVKSLASMTAGSGSDYLKKIVQVAFDIPQASRPRMLTIFRDRLNKILDQGKVKMRWDNERINEIFEDHLWSFFHTLRDVKRFLGSFDFYFCGHINRGVLEVNPVDLLILEILRMFDHEAYEEVRGSLGYLSSRNLARLLFQTGDHKKRVQIKIDSITSRPGLSEDSKEHLGAILRALFPEETDAETLAKADRDLRVCHPSHFPKYFEYAFDDGPTSAANLRALLEIVSNRSDFAKRLRELCATDAIHEVLDKLRIYFDEIPAESAEDFIGAFFDMGDDLPVAKGQFLEQEPIREAARLIFALLRKLPDNAVRGKMLLRTLSSTSGIILPVMIVGILESAKRKPNENPSLLDERDIAEMRSDVLGRITALASSGAIWKSRHFQLLIFRWRDWAGQTTVNDWLGEQLSTPEKRLDFVSKMLTRTIINGSRVSYFLNGKAIEEFFPLETLVTDIEGIAATSLDSMAVIARTVLVRTAKLKAEGKDYSEVYDKGEFGM